MEEEANRAAHRLAKEERREGVELRVLFDGIEEGKAVLDDKIDAGYESLEAVGSAMALEVESEAGETLLGKKDGSGLEGPRDVVAVAVDHEDEGARRRRSGGKGKP